MLKFSTLALVSVLALTACQAPALDEQDSATAHAQQAAEAAKAPEPAPAAE